LANLGKIHKEKARSIRSGLSSLQSSQRAKAVSNANNSADKGKKYYREAIEIHSELNGAQSIDAAAAMNELAWLVYNFTHADSGAAHRAQIDEAEELYTRAVKLYESAGTTTVQLHLQALQDFADFYMKYVNFEKAYPLYEKHVALVENKFGRNDARLVPGLRGLAQILAITERKDDAEKLRARIASITGRAESREIDLPLLRYRARKVANVSSDEFLPTDPTDVSRTRSIIQTYGGVYPYVIANYQSLEVAVLVDEKGDVIEAKALKPSKYEKKIEEAAMNSKFRPFIYNDTPQKMRGKIVFMYRN